LPPKVKIVTDSTVYLPEGVDPGDIRIVPLKVAFGDEVYTEGVDITKDEFYHKLQASSVLPVTSQPSANDFLEVYSELAQKGHPILSIHISTKLSGTVNSALAARSALPGAQIEVVDWLSKGFGLLVLAAAQAAEAGQQLLEIKSNIEYIVRGMNQFGVLDTLEHLWRGGRIGAARALLGTMLRIKPVLALEDGEAKVLAKVRTSTKAVEYMLNLMEKKTEGSTACHCCVAHTCLPDEARALQKEVQARFNCAELYVIEFGPVYGTHLGPGFLGLGFYTE